MTPRAWAALWAVYVIWGSTYLGIKVAGDTIPSFFAVSTRFLIAGGLMATWVMWRGGRGALRVRRSELASAALIGLLLPGANGILFVAERTVPTGLASLIIASVPLLVVLMRLAGGERPPMLAVVGVLVGFAGVAVLFHPEGDATWWGIGLTGISAFAWVQLAPPIDRDVVAEIACHGECMSTAEAPAIDDGFEVFFGVAW